MACDTNRQAAAASGQQLPTEDAMNYVNDVREKFKDDMEKWNEFLEVMKDYRTQWVDVVGVLTRVKDLFKEHRELILGFTTFLPREYEITLWVEEKKQPAVESDQAINNGICDGCRNNPCSRYCLRYLYRLY